MELAYVDRAGKWSEINPKEIEGVYSKNVNTGRDDTESDIAYVCVRFTNDTGDTVYMDSTGTQDLVKKKSDDTYYHRVITDKKHGLRIRVWGYDLDDNATAYWRITKLEPDKLEDNPKENHFSKITLYNKNDEEVDQWYIDHDKPLYIDHDKPLYIEYQRCGIKFEQ